MALKVRIKSIVNNKPSGYIVYTELYDDNFPEQTIAGKQFTYTTAVSDEHVLKAVRNAYAGSAVAYVNKTNVRSHLENVLSTLTVVTT